MSVGNRIAPRSGERRILVLERVARAHRRLRRLFGKHVLRLGFRDTYCTYVGNASNKRKEGDALWVAGFATRKISPSEGQSIDGWRTGHAEYAVEVVGGEHLTYYQVFLALSRG